MNKEEGKRDQDAAGETWEQVGATNAPMTIRSPDGVTWQVYGGESLLRRLNAYHNATQPTALQAALERETQRMRGRPVTNAEAFKAAERLIARAHNGPGEKSRMSIPVRADDDDVLLTDYLTEVADAATVLRRVVPILGQHAVCSRCGGDGSPQCVTCDDYQYCNCKPGYGRFADKCWACEGTGIGIKWIRALLSDPAIARYLPAGQAGATQSGQVEGGEMSEP